ncbi:hypothetical protein EWM64_g2833 [Hericium alpestre]|uniref:Uncharacterized protein n=1 Tax=Hericium alpestre TaxID=135208 RepID=A0A4Z0A4K6_9AGAM|nr:hypothetical protein EWM64_g2833 [Hericium alpestre]
MAHDTAVKRLMFKHHYPLGLDPERLKDLVDEASKEQLWYLQWDIGIPLDEFLIALLGDDHAAQVWASFPDNVPQARGKYFGKVFANARIRFSHFVQAYDTTVISDGAMWAALACGMAYQCPTTHKAIDIMIPVLLRDENLSRHVVTAIFIRVNDRWDEPKPMINAEGLGFFTTADADGRSLTRPYITVLMDLGGYQSQRMFTEDPFIRPGNNPSSEDPSHLRYSFVIKGCSPSVYPYVIRDGSTKNYFAYLLRHGAMMDEHPRQQALSSVTQLKPFWSSNLNSFSWAGESRDSHTASRHLFSGEYVESREDQREEASDNFEILSFASDGMNELW